MILLARTTPLTQVSKPSGGLSLFFIPLRKSDPTLRLSRIPKMGGRAIDANEVFFDSYSVPASCLVGTEGDGFKRAARYAQERVVFGRPIGANQGIQHPLAEAYMNLEAAKHSTYHAARLYDQSTSDPEVSAQAVGIAANSAKFVAAEAAFKACERAVLTLGGMGYSQEFHVERYLRECFVPRIAPVSRVSRL
jgi:acyl-CoA dehydrogenase